MSSMTAMASGLVQALRAQGFEPGIVPVTRLDDLREDLEGLRREGLLDEEVYETYMKGFRYSAPEALPEARSIVVMAYPQPRMRLRFAHQGREVEAIVPPTYANAQRVMDAARAALQAAAPGARFEKAVLPLKTLAARAGLVRYGRNNITYLPRAGSFHRLTAFLTDLDLGVDDWQEREALPACATCRRCLEACPAAAISEDRFLVRAERCLTFHNEMPSQRPFPPQTRSDWHNAIIGCMRCQEACPYDKDVRDWTEQGERFSQDETRFLLEGDFSGPQAKAMNEKLERCGLDLSVFPRNLKALLGL